MLQVRCGTVFTHQQYRSFQPEFVLIGKGWGAGFILYFPSKADLRADPTLVSYHKVCWCSVALFLFLFGPFRPFLFLLQRLHGLVTVPLDTLVLLRCIRTAELVLEHKLCVRALALGSALEAILKTNTQYVFSCVPFCFFYCSPFLCFLLFSEDRVVNVAGALAYTNVPVTSGKVLHDRIILPLSWDPDFLRRVLKINVTDCRFLG